MKIAKPGQKDLDAALELVGLLDCLSSGYYPMDPDKPQNDSDPLRLDDDDPEHLAHVWRLLRRVLDKAPGFQGRVIFGGVTLMDPHKKILDASLDHIALHPRFVPTPAADGTDQQWAAAAQAIATRARSVGKVITIAQHPLKPLAMGHHEDVVEVREVRQ